MKTDLLAYEMNLTKKEACECDKPGIYIICEGESQPHTTRTCPTFPLLPEPIRRYYFYYYYSVANPIHVPYNLSWF